VGLHLAVDQACAGDRSVHVLVGNSDQIFMSWPTFVFIKGCPAPIGSDNSTRCGGEPTGLQKKIKRCWRQAAWLALFLRAHRSAHHMQTVGQKHAQWRLPTGKTNAQKLRPILPYFQYFYRPLSRVPSTYCLHFSTANSDRPNPGKGTRNGATDTHAAVPPCSSPCLCRASDPKAKGLQTRELMIDFQFSPASLF